MYSLQKFQIQVSSFELLIRTIASPIDRWFSRSLVIYAINFPLIPNVTRNPILIIPILSRNVLGPLKDSYNLKNLAKAGEHLIPGIIWIVLVLVVHPTILPYVGLLRWLTAITSGFKFFVAYGAFLLLLQASTVIFGVLRAWLIFTTILINTANSFKILLREWYFDYQVWIYHLAIILAVRTVELLVCHVVGRGMLGLWHGSEAKLFYFPAYLLQWAFMAFITVCEKWRDRTSLAYIRARQDSIPRATPLYDYTPLPDDGKTIRLLLLHPRHPSAPVTCSLIEIALDDAPGFQAMSYTWGALSLTEPILVNGRVLFVTTNAHSLLRGISSNLLPRLLWIDSICINQSSIPEKTAQVQLMAQIYQRASLVTVYLSHPDASQPQGSFERFAASNDANTAFTLVRALRNLVFSQFSDRQLIGLMASWRARRTWPAFTALLRNPWFERIWCVQEVVLARRVRVLYAGVEIDWHTMGTGLAQLASKPALGSVVESTVDFRVRTRANIWPLAGLACTFQWARAKAQGEKVTFWDIMDSSRFFKATDPRDLVFGVQALCEKGRKDWTKPDYELTLDKVFLNATLRLIDEVGIPSVLSIAGIGLYETARPELENSPSWVPDWTQARLLKPLADPRQKKAPYAAGGVPTDNSHHGQRGQSLFLRFRPVDKICELADRWYIDENEQMDWVISEFKEMRRRLTQSYTMVLQSPRVETRYSYTNPPPQLHDAFWRTLIGDRSGDMRPAPDSLGAAFGQYVELLDVLASVVDSGENRMMTEEAVKRFKDAPMYGHLTLMAWAERTVGVTEKGYIGLFPPFAKAGDLVCVVEGVQTPLVLRRAGGEGSPKFKLVGESFVLGLMDGEGIADDYWTTVEIV